MTDKQHPVAWCALTASGDIAYFDGKPMVMVGPVGNEHHQTALYAAPQAQPAQPMPLVQATAQREIWLQISDEARDNAETFPDGFDGITWSKDSATVCGVPYVRADLAQAQPAPLRDPLIVIRKRPGKTPCGECHLQAGEVCDICGAAQPAKDAA